MDSKSIVIEAQNQITLPFFDELHAGVSVSDMTTSPLSMQYLGCKSRITDWIIANIRNKFCRSSIFYDLFAGTGSVSCAAMQHNYQICANDVQPYSYIVLKSLFDERREGLIDVAHDIKKLKAYQRLMSSGRGNMGRFLAKEDAFFYSKEKNRLNWQEYKDFCNEVTLVAAKKDIDDLRYKNNWNLFVNYYANTYFGIKQCLELDSIREYSDKLSPHLKSHLIAATISAMTFAVSSTTHLAQFLKASSKETVINLLNKRSISIIDEVANRLVALRHYPLPIGSTVMNLNYQEAIKAVDLNKNWVVYVDPPYFKEHYSRYYHVLDTYLLYDYPYLTFNPRINDVSRGRYRQDRFVSEFGLKRRVEKAFQNIFDICRKDSANVAVSYANTSLVSKERLLEIAAQAGFKVSVEEIALMHSGQGQPRHKNVTEYLFLLEV